MIFWFNGITEYPRTSMREKPECDPFSTIPFAMQAKRIRASARQDGEYAML